ncbi:shikimate dehydrogenase [candidate division KSB1 bacterium]|nr:shikimate dehydrogenase [candidate division KSB1 bacterium]
MSEKYFRFGLLGQQIAYSLSPRIFDWALREAGLAGSYESCSLAESDVAVFMWTHVKSLDGLNVTVPYKTVVAGLCHELSADASRIGAVNTAYWSGNRLIGDNTDSSGFGFALDLLLKNRPPCRRVLVIGGGGAARATLLELERRGVREVTVAARDTTRAESTLQHLAFSGLRVVPLNDCISGDGYDLMIQATPIGSVNQPGTPVPRMLPIDSATAVMDLIYAPRETEFLRQARECGAQTMNGLPMLIAQAAAAFEIWTGVRFALEKAMLELLPEFSPR